MRKRSERSRWTTIYTLPQPVANADGAMAARANHAELRAVVSAFESVGRVVRVETGKFGTGLVLKARKA